MKNLSTEHIIAALEAQAPNQDSINKIKSRLGKVRSIDVIGYPPYRTSKKKKKSLKAIYDGQMTLF